MQGIDSKILSRIYGRGKGSVVDRKQLLRDIRYAPAWIAAILRRVAGPEGK